MTGLPLKITSGWWGLFIFSENKTSCACFKGLRMRLIFHWWAHVSIFFKSSLVSFAEVSRSCTTENYEVSLAKSLGFEDRFSAKSMILIKDSSDPKIELWGTPAWIFSQLDVCHKEQLFVSCFLENLQKYLVSCQICDSALIGKKDLRAIPYQTVSIHTTNFTRNTPRISWP